MREMPLLAASDPARTGIDRIGHNTKVRISWVWRVSKVMTCGCLSKLSLSRFDRLSIVHLTWQHLIQTMWSLYVKLFVWASYLSIRHLLVCSPHVNIGRHGLACQFRRSRDSASSLVRHLKVECVPCSLSNFGARFWAHFLIHIELPVS